MIIEKPLVMKGVLKICCALSLALLVSAGCDQKKKPELPSVDIQGIRQTDDLSEIVRIDGLTVLEESDGSMLVHPDKAFVLADGSLILKDMGSRILKFSPDGSFAMTIGRRGRGPQEYSLCRDIALSVDGSELSVMALGDILAYDAGDGHFIRRTEIPRHNYDEFCYGPDGGFYLFSASQDMEDYSELQAHDLLTLISPDGAEVLKTLPRQDYIMNVSLFTRSGKGNTWLRPLEGENILYELTESGIKPVLSVDFGNLQSPSGYMANNGAMDLQRYIMSRYYKMALYVHDTDEALYFGCMGPDAKGLHYVTDLSGQKGCSWADREDDPAPTMILASDRQSFHALVFDVETKLSADAEALNPLDRAIMQEVRGREIQPNGNPLLVRLSFRMR